MIDVSIIIVNYNTKELTFKSIESVQNFTKDVNFEIIVVDNASLEPISEEISSKYPSVIFIQNQQNVGFGRANNQAIKISQGEFVFLLNSDAFLTSNSLKVFVDFMRLEENNRVAVCGADLISDSHEQMISYGAFPSLSQAFLEIGFFVFIRKYFYQKLAIAIINYDDKIKEVDYITGADAFFRKSVLDEVGAFDPDFFLYFEETELSYRIKKAGYKSVIIPSERIIHLEGHSQLIGDHTFNYKKYALYAESRNKFFKKCYGSTYATFAKLIYSMKLITFTISGKEYKKGNFFKKLWIIMSS
jgi:GT2 family glycosyltransferase